MGRESKIKGQLGEMQAKRYLEAQGYSILKLNYRSRYGEIDIVARQPGHQIVFVEVKTYKPQSMVHPLESITPQKKKRLQMTGSFYLARFAPTAMARFDLIIVRDEAIEQVENII